MDQNMGANALMSTAGVENAPLKTKVQGIGLKERMLTKSFNTIVATADFARGKSMRWMAMMMQANGGGWQFVWS